MDFTINFASNNSLRRQGALEVQSTLSGATLANGSVFGLVWRVSHQNGFLAYIPQVCTHARTHTHTRARAHTHTHTHTHRSVKFYVLSAHLSRGSCSCFSLQHLPFLLLPDEVGPLYRIGSNMLAIREFQCYTLHVEAAVVTQFGVGSFSSPHSQCFYGTHVTS